jgi:hypothetical protein
MGYTTEFVGRLTLTPPASEEQRDYINLLARTRRMKRDVSKLMDKYEGEHGNPFAEDNTPESIYGKDGEYFARNDGQYGQLEDGTIIDYNNPPGQLGHEDYRIMGHNMWNENQRRINNGECQPGLWLQWNISDDCEHLQWNGGEKFSWLPPWRTNEYEAWLQYLINHFFDKWGINLNGRMRFEGEDPDDRGVIQVRNNVIGRAEPQRIVSPEDPYGEEDWDTDLDVDY